MTRLGLCAFVGILLLTAACDDDAAFVEDDGADAGDAAALDRRYRRLPDGAVVLQDESDASAMEGDGGDGSLSVEDAGADARADAQADASADARVPTPVVPFDALYNSVLTAASCALCHPAVASNKTPDFSTIDKAYASLALDSTERCDGKPYVVPGDVDRSFLWDLVSKSKPGCDVARMPQGLPPLTPEQLAIMKRWIESGAQR